MEKVGLVLQGGGMRGVYTSGVLDFFMEKDLYFSYTIAVSAGACNAIAYTAKQRGLGKKICMNYMTDTNCMGVKTLLTKGSIIEMDLVFDKIPNRLKLLDFDTINTQDEKLIITATDCCTGAPIYIEKDKCEDIITAVKASSSVPFLTKTVEFKELNLLDGGISDPIPIKKSIEDGNIKNVVVLTSEDGYNQKPFKMKWLANKIYPQYKDLVCSILECHRTHNDSMDYIKELEKDGKTFVIRPSKYLKLKTFDRNSKRIEALYSLGYEDTKNKYNELLSWLKH